MITKAERAELRSLIRQRFKVLRADVEQRQYELIAELEERITERFAADDKAWADVAFVIGEAAREANRKANDAIREHVGRDGWPDERRVVVGASDITQIRAAATNKPQQEKSQLRRQGTARIEATVKSAQLSLDRQEADLLTRLVTGALESEEARAFLGEIPTVSALVPADRLLALEQQLRSEP